MGDQLSDLRGESLPDDGMQSDQDPELGAGWSFLDTVLKVWNAPFVAAAGLGETYVETYGEVVVNAQDTFGAVVEDVSEAANPLNLLGLGAGVTFGGVVAVAGLGVVAAFAVDQVFFAGTGTLSLVNRVARR